MHAAENAIDEARWFKTSGLEKKHQKNPKKHWHRISYRKLSISEAEPDASFECDYEGTHLDMGITSVPLGDGAYTGDILRNNHIIGEWHLKPKMSVCIKSYVHVNDVGQYKRYAGGEHATERIACRKIKKAVSIWRVLQRMCDPAPDQR